MEPGKGRGGYTSAHQAHIPQGQNVKVLVRLNVSAWSNGSQGHQHSLPWDCHTRSMSPKHRYHVKVGEGTMSGGMEPACGDKNAFQNQPLLPPITLALIITDTFRQRGGWLGTQHVSLWGRHQVHAWEHRSTQWGGHHQVMNKMSQGNKAQ